MSKPAIILISHDSRGLGSFRRQCNIAAALHAQSPSTSLYLATSCTIRPPPYLHVLKLPMHTETLARSRFLLRCVQKYKPNALLVDKHPLGVCKDFTAAMHWANAQSIACFYGLRDILDHPDRIHTEWAEFRVHMSRWFRKILVYGQKDLFDVTRYGLNQSQIEYCGYVSLSTPVHKVQHGILCTVGGGDSALATEISRVFWDCDLPKRKTLVSGPFNNVVLSAKHEHQHIGYYPDMLQMWATHDTVVCMGGYNSLIEAMFYGLHVICIPRVEPRLEQLMRAQIFSDKGWIHFIHPSHFTAQSLYRAVTQSLVPNGRPNFRGAQHAAKTILNEIGLHPKVVS